MIRKIDEEISKKIKRHLRRVKWYQYICLSVNLHHTSNFTIVNAALKYENMCIVSKKYVLKRDRHVIFPIYISLNENTHIFFFVRNYVQHLLLSVFVVAVVMENNGISYQLTRAKMKMVESNCRITNNALDRLDTHKNWTATNNKKRPPMVQNSDNMM